VGKIQSIVDDTVAAGGKVAPGGTHHGLFYSPTVLSGATTDMRAWTDEVFGPVAPVIAFSTIEEAIALAQDTEYGLSLGILGEVGLAMQLADAIPQRDRAHQRADRRR
jgi:benzaldehyde dehydrogenase (NAD)